MKETLLEFLSEVVQAIVLTLTAMMIAATLVCMFVVIR